MSISLLLIRFSLIFSPLLIVLIGQPMQAQADTALPTVYPTAAKTAVAATTKKVLPPPSSQQVSQPKNPTPSSQSINETMAEFTAANTLVQNLEVLEIYNNIFTAAYEAAPKIQVARKQQQQSEELYTAWARRISPKVNANFSQIREFNTTDDDSYTEETQTYSYEDGDEISIAGCLNTLGSVDEKYEDIEHFTNKMNAAQRQIFFKDNSLLYSQILLEKQLADQQATTFTQREYPDLTVRGYYDRLDDTQFTKFNGEGSLALVLSVPLFTGGTIFSTTKTQAIAQHIAEVNQYTDLRAQQINLRQQEEIVVLPVKSYRIKQTSMQDLLTSQNKLIDAKNALIQTTNRLAALYRQVCLRARFSLSTAPNSTITLIYSN